MRLAEPRPATAAMFLLAVPGLAQRFKPVPDGYWDLHHGERARVRCPCGNRPVLSPGQLMACRDLAASPHRCDRTFVFAGRSMLVYRP